MSSTFSHSMTAVMRRQGARTFCSESGSHKGGRSPPVETPARQENSDKVYVEAGPAHRLLDGGHRGQPRRLFAAGSTLPNSSSGLALISPSVEPMSEHLFRLRSMVSFTDSTAPKLGSSTDRGSLHLCFLPRMESVCVRRAARSGYATRESGLRVPARLRASSR